MSKRFAIVIGVAAAAVMALGAQTATALPHHYHTRVTIVDRQPSCCYYGRVYSEVHKCKPGRRVVLFKKRPGADTRLGKDISRLGDRWTPQQYAGWWIDGPNWEGRRLYAKVMPKRKDEYVCRADRSPIYDGA